ncbi:MAG: endonuclease V [Candidatus Aenigmarchaeota archaeon]|nr:endonuclease V [Candidatus Aenigmarchaeota archaeon]
MTFQLTKKYEEKLRRIQKRIVKKVILEDDFSKPISTIAGFDSSFSDDTAFVAGIVLDYKRLDVIEMKFIRSKLKFPYITTFLAFREGPSIIKVYKKLKIKPDVIMINGHGISHPIFCGIASHVGVLLDVPSIGVAQTKLCGEFKELKRVGEHSVITYENKKVGYAYKSKENCEPIFISPGHKVSLETSLEIVKSTIRNHKLPEPIFIAHSLANKIKISNKK